MSVFTTSQDHGSTCGSSPLDMLFTSLLLRILCNTFLVTELISLSSDLTPDSLVFAAGDSHFIEKSTNFMKNKLQNIPNVTSVSHGNNQRMRC